MVILNSGFCALKSIIVLKKCGFYTSALIKKRIYSPKFINGGAIKLYMADNEVVTQARLPGKL